MPRFFVMFDGVEQDIAEADFPDVDRARDAAIVRLGHYLQDHPEFAYARHWRVDLLDSSRRLLLHVLVGTVMAPPSINLASFDEQPPPRREPSRDGKPAARRIDRFRAPGLVGRMARRLRRLRPDY